MIGAFKPSAALSGGLLWKIPWRMSAPQKLRQRRRLRRVDNIVAVLDNALKRQTVSSAALTTSSYPSTSSSPSASSSSKQAQTSRIPLAGSTVIGDLSGTANFEARMQGHGLRRQGEMLSGQNTTQGVQQVLSRTATGQTQAATTGTVAAIERWKSEMPTEAEMLPRDKYTMFDRKAKKYRKGVHKLPKWTRVSQRLNPPGF